MPWNDRSLELVAERKEDLAKLVCVNDLVLPERFIAIYHRDRKQMEYIFSSLFDDEDPVPAQRFAFRWRSRDYVCQYGPPSEELLLLARMFKPVRASSSDHRHLEPLHDLELQDEFSSDFREYLASQKALSFFVDNIESYDEERAIALAKHLNFYMSYFDRGSPRIDIVSSPPAAEATRTPPKKVGIVPPVVNAVELDSFLLDLNLAAQSGEARLRFLYYYQILEYAAFYWVEESVKTAVCKVLQAPDLQSNIEEYFPKLIEALVPTRQNDEHKIRRVIESRVDVGEIWEEISSDLQYFYSKHQFEGGFCVEPLVSMDTSEEAFSKLWTPKLFETIRAIRNSLVHARESRTEAVIVPSAANSRLLRPWIPIVRRMAEQVTIYDR